MTLKAPFPYFGGKSAVAEQVWQRFGDVPNYVEPFCGSAAMLLARPPSRLPRRVETINDKDGFVVNFWRAATAAPEAVAAWCSWPVSERDLEARHYWLVTEGREILDRILTCPTAFDARIAGWWVWGACSWIGSGWCSGRGPWSPAEDGIWVRGGDIGVNRQLPMLSGGDGKAARMRGVGINRHTMEPRDEFILGWLVSLGARLREVRITCGDWSRVCTPAVTWRHGKTAVFGDPPYLAGRTEGLYAQDSLNVGKDFAAWCVADEQSRPDMLIAYCGYYEESLDALFPDDWERRRWKAGGGYGSQGDGQGRANAERECIWFSPSCSIHQSLPRQMALIGA